MDVQISSPKGQEELQTYREQEEGESMAGCTANVCLITKTEIYVANAGDSRSVLRQNKVISFLLKANFLVIGGP
jgi:serine/threonine protein phosphatase PrpC